MDPLFHLVERRIAEAEQAGAFAELPGRGRPLELEDLSAVPAELRAGYLLLRGAGFVPPELAARKEALRLTDLLAACRDAAERERLTRAAQQAWLRCRLLMEERGASQAWLEYRDEVLARLQRG